MSSLDPPVTHLMRRMNATGSFRLRPQDTTDLAYLVMATGMTEGTVIPVTCAWRRTTGQSSPKGEPTPECLQMMDPRLGAVTLMS